MTSIAQNVALSAYAQSSTSGFFENCSNGGDECKVTSCRNEKYLALVSLLGVQKYKSSRKPICLTLELKKMQNARSPKELKTSTKASNLEVGQTILNPRSPSLGGKPNIFNPIQQSLVGEFSGSDEEDVSDVSEHVI